VVRMFEGKTTLDAEVELLDGSMLVLILFGMDASDVMEVEPSFRLSSELMILNEGNSVSEDATEWMDETAREPFCGGRSSRNPRELALTLVSLTGTSSTVMWG